MDLPRGDEVRLLLLQLVLRPREVLQADLLDLMVDAEGNDPGCELTGNLLVEVPKLLPTPLPGASQQKILPLVTVAADFPIFSLLTAVPVPVIDHELLENPRLLLESPQFPLPVRLVEYFCKTCKRNSNMTVINLCDGWVYRVCRSHCRIVSESNPHPAISFKTGAWLRSQSLCP